VRVDDKTQRSIAIQLIQQGQVGRIYGADGRKGVLSSNGEILSLSLRHSEKGTFKLNVEEINKSETEQKKLLELCLIEMVSAEDSKGQTALLSLVKYINNMVNYDNQDKLEIVMKSTSDDVSKFIAQCEDSTRKALIKSVMNQYNRDMEDTSFDTPEYDAGLKINAMLDAICNILLGATTIARSNAENVVVAFGAEHIKMLRDIMNEIGAKEVIE
jgi:hypothetical protein